ncbi:hypothetical protein BJ741DRAFT_603648 [Chytriomyces cf. hyalinus JEL632]|nr:hypothetical protein BJ741DRAFT_603648 [Chytriomyces cf. hyalinus JEL632]
MDTSMRNTNEHALLDMWPHANANANANAQHLDLHFAMRPYPPAMPSVCCHCVHNTPGTSTTYLANGAWQRLALASDCSSASPKFQSAISPLDLTMFAMWPEFGDCLQIPSNEHEQTFEHSAAMDLASRELCAVLGLPYTGSSPESAGSDIAATGCGIRQSQMHQAGCGPYVSHTPSSNANTTAATHNHRNLPRSRFSKETLALLKLEYATNPVPAPTRITALAAQLDATPAKVKVWFQNYRAARKGKGDIPPDLATHLAAKNKPRDRMPRSAVETLWREFHTNPIPSFDRIVRLACELKRSPKQVKTWFQNARARAVAPPHPSASPTSSDLGSL